MVADVYDTILQELGEIIDAKDLHVDDKKTCLIKFASGLEVYIEPYEKGDYMLIYTELGSVPPGRFREDVFREALKMNGKPYPRYGTYAFSEETDKLVLYKLMALKELNGEKLSAFLIPYMEKALNWKNSIDGGVVPLADTMTTSGTRPGGLFGLTP